MKRVLWGALSLSLALAAFVGAQPLLWAQGVPPELAGLALANTLLSPTVRSGNRGQSRKTTTGSPARAF